MSERKWKWEQKLKEQEWKAGVEAYGWIFPYKAEQRKEDPQRGRRDKGTRAPNRGEKEEEEELNEEEELKEEIVEE